MEEVKSVGFCGGKCFWSWSQHWLRQVISTLLVPIKAWFQEWAYIDIDDVTNSVMRACIDIDDCSPCVLDEAKVRTYLEHFHLFVMVKSEGRKCPKATTQDALAFRPAKAYGAHALPRLFCIVGNCFLGLGPPCPGWRAAVELLLGLGKGS
ncbi:unnamed protein product [Prunus armeniaca]